MAGEYPCNNIDLLSLVTPLQLQADTSEDKSVSDLWGWTDNLTDKEYAIVGMVNGTSFIDVTDPLSPIVLGHLPFSSLHKNESEKPSHGSPSSLWKDVKVYQNHAFIVSEAQEFGMQVFDLTRLRNISSPPQIFTYDAKYTGVSNAHNIVINPNKGIAYICGALGDDTITCRGGGLHIVDISDPISPYYLGCFDEGGYVHDAQCVTYDGPDSDYSGRELCFNSSADTLVVADVTDPSNIITVCKTGYDSIHYFHQGWLTEDQRYFLSNDELDEYDTGVNTQTHLFDLEDLDAPEYLGFHEGPTKAVDHNLYIDGSLVYQSNYTAGLRILELDLNSGVNMEEVAYFDTYPNWNGAGFSGSWSNYPYFKSGTIIVSDFQRGLFILRAFPSIAGNHELNVHRAINLFPTPAINKIYYQTPVDLSVTQIQMTDMNGKQVTLEPNPSNSLNLDGFSPGVYALRFTFSDQTTSSKRIILR